MGVSPFSRDLLDLNEAQIDFILEMQAIDDPEHFQFTRTANPKMPSQSEVAAAWERVLIGKAKTGFLDRIIGAGTKAGLQKWLSRNKDAINFMKQRPRA